MVFSSVIQKTVSFSPKLTVPITLHGIIGTSRGTLLLSPTRSFCKSVSEIRQPDEVKILSKDTTKVVDSGDLNQNGNTRVSDQVLLDYLKVNKSDSIDPSSVNLGGYSYQVKEHGNGIFFTRNEYPHEEVRIEVNMSIVEAKKGNSDKPIPFFLIVSREYDGVEYENQFIVYLSRKKIVVHRMRIVENPSLDIRPDGSYDDSSDGSSDGTSDDSSNDSSNDSSDDSSDDRSDEAEEKCADKNKKMLKKYNGPDFKELDDRWQRGIHSYLESRGIKPDMFSSFRDYIVNKKKRDAATEWKSKFMELFLR